MPRRNDEIEAEWSAYSQRFATSLRSARERAGLSQEDVAYRSGLTRYTYQKYEKGESRPADSSWGRNTRILCFGEELSELLGGGEVSVSFAGPGVHLDRDE
ncbi:helix-turn-helix transcriptional regulator, partial [Microbacterium aerolatum]|uniref:helix-turn-helix domain-containing protein n=1 Tax=Microbacterium aerolatum TaxID=153731 RepID=UPI002001BCAE